MQYHDWVQKADLQPANDAGPDHIALDETVIRINGHNYWLYAAFNRETNKFHHIRAFTTRKTVLAQKFLRDIYKKSYISVAVFPLIVHSFSVALNRAGLRFQTVRHGNRNAVERVFREIKRRKFLFTTVSATLIQQPQKHGCNRSLSGVIRLSKHNAPSEWRRHATHSRSSFVITGFAFCFSRLTK